MKFMIEKVRFIELPKIVDIRGNLSFFENSNQIPFDIKRVYWIYDVPGGEIRGGHAYRTLNELIVALSGSFDIVYNDGTSEKRINLNRSYYGLYVPAMMWRHIENFSTNSLALIAASAQYDEHDYIRDFDLYTEMIHDGSK